MTSPARYCLNKELLKIKPYIKGVTIDLACGSFPLSKQLGVKSYNLDLYPNKLVDLIGDIHKLPLKNNSFDTVLFINALEHIKNPEALLAEAKRVMKKNGRLIITIPFLQRYHKDPIDLWRYTPESMKILLKDFKIVYQKEVGRVYTVILDFLHQNSPFPKFIILLLEKLIYPIENWLDKVVEHTSMWIIVAEKK